MRDFALRLDEICDALAAANYEIPEEFSAHTIRLAKSTAATMVDELRASLRRGLSDVEAMATFPVALAFLVNVYAYCTDAAGDPVVVERIMQTATRMAHALGDGDATFFQPQRKSSVSSH